MTFDLNFQKCVGTTSLLWTQILRCPLNLFSPIQLINSRSKNVHT